MSDPVLSAVVCEVRDDFFRGLNVVSGQSVALSVAECREHARVTLLRTTSAPHSGGGRPAARGLS
jgi:hypothetical protein